MAQAPDFHPVAYICPLLGLLPTACLAQNRLASSGHYFAILLFHHVNVLPQKKTLADINV